MSGSKNGYCPIMSLKKDVKCVKERCAMWSDEDKRCAVGFAALDDGHKVKLAMHLIRKFTETMQEKALEDLKAELDKHLNKKRK